MAEGKGISVFLSYVSRDEEFANELITRLQTLEDIDSLWHKGSLTAGQEWQEETSRQLGASQLILALVSPDFLHSFYNSVEMSCILNQYSSRQSCIVPILVRRSDWKNSELSKFKPLPANGKAVKKWKDLDDAYQDIIEGIRKVIDHIKAANLNLKSSVDGRQILLPPEEAEFMSSSNSSFSQNTRRFFKAKKLFVYFALTVSFLLVFQMSQNTQFFNQNIKEHVDQDSAYASNSDGFNSFCDKINKQNVNLAPNARNIKLPDINEKSEGYFYSLLDLALNGTDESIPKRFKFECKQVKTPQIKVLKHVDDSALKNEEDIEDEEDIDVAWMMNTHEREYRAKPIKIPLTMGLLGYRVCMVHQKGDRDVRFDLGKSRDRPSGELSAEDFHYSVGQMRNWPDTRILLEAGIHWKPPENNRKSSLYRMLKKDKEADHHIDCFARGVNEVFSELQSSDREDLGIEKGMYFHYRSPVYFYVSFDDSDLESRIREGLEDRKLEHCNLLMEHYGDSIRKVDLPERTRISLENKDFDGHDPSREEPPDGYFPKFENLNSTELEGYCPVL